MMDLQRDYELENEIRELIDSYRKDFPIRTLCDMIDVSVKFYYNMLDSRVIPSREFITRLVLELHMTQTDAILLFRLKGYYFPIFAEDKKVLDKLPK